MIVNIEKKSEEIGLKPQFVKMLFDSFMQENIQIVSDLQKAVVEKNFEMIEHYAHSIKGSSGNLKLNELYELAKSIEFAAKDKKDSFDYKLSLKKLQTILDELEVVQS